MTKARFPRRITAVATAVALAVGGTIMPAHAQENTISIDLQQLVPALSSIAEEATDEENFLFLYEAARSVTVNGQGLPEIDFVQQPDAVIEGTEGVGTEVPEIEEEVAEKNEEKGRPQDRGVTSDGREVVFPTKGRFTSGYGPRWGRTHYGIDIANSIGTPILAVMDGKVIAAGPASGYGNWVVIEHAGGEKSIYGHMKTINVSVGQQVSAGQKIAEIGNEGRSTGPHLHFEIRPNGNDAVDPVPWFAQQGISVHNAIK